MNEEDEAFNEIEQKAKQRMEAVQAALEPYLEVYLSLIHISEPTRPY